MLSLYLNGDGDFEFDEINNLKMIDGLAELKQRLWLAMTTRGGEWFLDPSLGIPWFDILGNTGSEDAIKQEIIRVLKADAAIDSITKLTLDKTDRNLSVYFECSLTDGTAYEQMVEVG